MLGHNNPPVTPDDVLAQHENLLLEARNWADGSPVQNAEQAAAVEALIKGVKGVKKDLTDAGDAVVKPLYAAYQGEQKTWKAATDKTDLMVKALLAVIDPWKQAEMARVEADRKAKWEAARKAEEDARVLAAASGDAIDDAEAVEAARLTARAAQMEAKQVESVKGMRTFEVITVAEISTAAAWIAEHDPAVMQDFVETYARKAKHPIPGVVRTTEKRAV